MKLQIVPFIALVAANVAHTKHDKSKSDLEYVAKLSALISPEMRILRR